MSAVTHAKGLLEGKRLRRCSPRARLFWPYLFLMANGYARIELDYELLEEKFLAFRNQAPDREEIEKFYAEYAANHLIYTYAGAGQQWVQECGRPVGPSPAGVSATSSNQVSTTGQDSAAAGAALAQTVTQLGWNSRHTVGGVVAQGTKISLDPQGQEADSTPVVLKVRADHRFRACLIEAKTFGPQPKGQIEIPSESQSP